MRGKRVAWPAECPGVSDSKEVIKGNGTGFTPGSSALHVAQILLRI
jgi:hypothetical protein